MTTDASPHSPNWKALYQIAMLEMDTHKVLPAIGRANDAILEKIEQTNRSALGNELSMLNDALNNLRLLRREHKRGIKEFIEQQNHRKLG